MTPTGGDRGRSVFGAGGESFLGRVIGEGESPAGWGVPIGRIVGCEIRVHLVTLIFVPAVLVYAAWNGLGVPYVATGLAALAVVVLLHEAARAHALVRWSGLRPLDATLWPLGAGWRFSEESQTAADEARGAAMGLVMMAGVIGGAGALVVVLAGDAGKLVFDPFRPGLVIAELGSTSTLGTVGLVAVWQTYAIAWYVLAANALPMLPLDGGLIFRWMGRRRPDAGALTFRVGLITAGIVLGGGLLSGLPLVAALGFCGGVVCWTGWQSERFLVDPAGLDRWRAALDDEPEPDETGGGRSPIQADEREKIEGILAKISEGGMSSLTRAERKRLARATEKLRGP
jgi:Zn-dependent protease